MQTTLDGAAQKWLSVLPMNINYYDIINQIGKDSHKSFQKRSILKKKTNNIKSSMQRNP